MASLQVGELFFREMYRRVGKVRQTAGVVGIAVRENDVRDVGGTEPHPLDLPEGRGLLMELKPRPVDRGLPDPFDRMRDVVQTDARVNERQPVVTFDQ